MYDQHTRRMARSRHRSLVERGGRKGFEREKSLAQGGKKCQHIEISNLNKI